MTEKELLQEALEWRAHITKLASDYSDQELFRKRLATIDWLIKQAERAQKNAQDLEDMDRQLFSEQQQNQRYKQALKFYANPKNHVWYQDAFDEVYPSEVMKDEGELARKALGYKK